MPFSYKPLKSSAVNADQKNEVLTKIHDWCVKEGFTASLRKERNYLMVARPLPLRLVEIYFSVTGNLDLEVSAEFFQVPKYPTEDRRVCCTNTCSAWT